MVTQKLTIRLDETELPEVRMVSGDIGREIQIEVYAREDSENPIDLETYSAEITIIKPDNTFIMDNFTVNKYELPENAGAVSGKGYYQIKIFTAGTHQIYTGQGPFLVDDMILSDDVIESSSIAFGDRFPEDFATKTWVDEEIEHAGLGTYVEGNPAGDPTESDLLKLQINDKIYPIPVPTVPETLDDLDDVEITSPTDGQALLYDDSDDKWKNQTLPDASVTKTATGNPIEITDGADAPLVKCVTQITGYQSGTGTPSPDNVRPITAYTEGGIEVRGVNKFPPASSNSESQNGITITHESGVYTISGTATGDVNITMALTENVNINPAVNKIEFMNSKANANIVLSLNRGNDVIHWWTLSLVNRVVEGWTDTGNENITHIRFAIPNGTETNFTISPMMIDKVKADIPTFYLFTKTTHTTTFPDAIYRGNEDLVKGEVTSEWIAFDMGDVTWTYNAGLDSMTVNLSLVKLPPTNAVAVDLICSTCQTIPADQRTTVTGMRAYILADSTTLYIRGSGYTSASDFKTAMTGQIIAYRLATPTTSPVTPTNLPIKSLSGYNHIESTTGEMEVKYITQQFEPLMPCHFYSTAEHVVGKWVDGSDVKEKTYIYTGTGPANPFTATIDMTGKSIIEVIPHYAKYTYGGGTVGYCAGSKLTESNSAVLKVEYDDATPPTVNVTSYLGSSTETYEIAFTIRYI